MGTAYKQPLSVASLPRTIVPGVFKPRIYDEIVPRRVRLNVTVTTPAECATLVQHEYRTATASEYSNVGGQDCFAVFEAVGVIFDPAMQVCLFE